MKLLINESTNYVDVPERYKSYVDVDEIYWLKDAFEEFGFNGKFIKSNQSFTYWQVEKNDKNKDLKIPAHFTSKSKARGYIKLIDELFH